MDWHWTDYDVACGSVTVSAQADKDGDVEIEYDAPYDGQSTLYIPAEVLAEVLRRSGYTVTKP